MSYHTARRPLTPQRRRRRVPPPIIMVIIVSIIMVGASVGVAVAQNNTRTTQDCTVTARFMTNTGGKNPHSIYQVETEQCGVLRVEDNLFQGVWNSADIYASLQPGRTYRIERIGWRIPWASQFPTVVKVSPK